MIRIIQSEVGQWVDDNFSKPHPAWRPLLGLAEEVGELSHAYLKRDQQIRLNEDHTANIRDAVGDITIFLMDFCNQEGLDLEDIIVETWNQVKQRNWKK